MLQEFRDLLFLDIETVSHECRFEDVKGPMADFWLKKATRLGAQSEEEQKELYAQKAGIFAEFGKIVTIALGRMVVDEGGGYVLRVKGISHHDERCLLEALNEEFARIGSSRLRLCGHNIKEFDIPYICRRMTVHGIQLPQVLDVAGKKPWEVHHVDTMELWKFGDRKNYTSLDLLAHLFGIPSSKAIMQNHQVGEFYYVKKDLPSIEAYCKEDIVATARVFCKLKRLPLPRAIRLDGTL